MRKIGVIVMAVVLMLSLCACEPQREEPKSFKEFMDDRTVVMCVDTNKLQNALTLKDFEGAGEELRHVSHGSGGTEMYVLKIKEDKNAQSVAERINRYTYVKFAYLNMFDYGAEVQPAEEKNREYKKEPDSNHSMKKNEIRVEIDRNFGNRIFTAEDFACINAISVTWETSLDYYKQGNFEKQRYTLKIAGSSEQDVVDAVEEVLKLDFVYHASPIFYEIGEL